MAKLEETAPSWRIPFASATAAEPAAAPTTAPTTAPAAAPFSAAVSASPWPMPRRVTRQTSAFVVVKAAAEASATDISAAADANERIRAALTRHARSASNGGRGCSSADGETASIKEPPLTEQLCCICLETFTAGVCPLTPAFMSLCQERRDTSTSNISAHHACMRLRDD